MILIDPVTTHGDTNLGNDTVPPGITGLDWCHIVSTDSLAELQQFLADNPDIGQPAGNIRTKSVTDGDGGSLITYAGLDATMREAAVAAGVAESNKRYVVSHAFDSAGQSVYEPGWT